MLPLKDALGLKNLDALDREIAARKALNAKAEIEDLLDRRITVEFEKVAVVDHPPVEPALFLGTIVHASQGDDGVMALKYADGRTLVLCGVFGVTVIKSTIVERKCE